MATLAAILGAGSVQAQSSVTIKGTIKGGFANTKLSGTGTGSQSAINDGSSQFHIAGTEDLGGGLKAVFQIDTRFRVDDNGTAPTSSPLATGNTYVGLTGGFGGLSVGKRDTHYCLGADTNGSRATALQASSCALLGFVGGQTWTAPNIAPATGTTGFSGSIANTSRSTNVIRYDLPTMGGLNGYFAYSTNPFGTEGAAGATSKGNGYALQLTYAAGPLNLGGSLWKAKGENRTSGTGVPVIDQEALTLTGGWNFGFMTAGLTYDRSQLTPTYIGAGSIDLKRNALSIPLTVPLGSGTVLFTYTKAQDVKINSTKLNNSSASLWTLGYDYALSKRTSVGVNYTVLDNKANANYNLYTQGSLGSTFAPGLGVDQKQFYVGVRHAF